MARYECMFFVLPGIGDKSHKYKVQEGKFCDVH